MTLEPPVNVSLINVGVKLPFGREGRELISFLGNAVQNRTFNTCKSLRGKQRGPPKTQRLLGETNVGRRCQKLTSRSSGTRTLSCLGISSVCQVPLHIDCKVFKTRETDGGRDIVRDTLYEQNRRAGSEFGVCKKRRGEGKSVVVPQSANYQTLATRAGDLDVRQLPIGILSLTGKVSTTG